MGRCRGNLAPSLYVPSGFDEVRSGEDEFQGIYEEDYRVEICVVVETRLAAMDVVVTTIHCLINNYRDFSEPIARGTNEPLSPVTNFPLEIAFSNAAERAQNTVTFRTLLQILKNLLTSSLGGFQVLRQLHVGRHG